MVEKVELGMWLDSVNKEWSCVDQLVIVCSELRNVGVIGAGDGEWLEVEVGEIDGFVLRGMRNVAFEVSSVSEHDDGANEASSTIKISASIA